MITRRFLSVFVYVGLVAGCTSTAPPAATIAPSAVASSTPAATIPTLGNGEQVLDAGTYRVELNQIAVTGAKLPAIQITVPAGWHGAGWLLSQPRPGEDVPPVAVQFWDVGMVYRQPCKWKGTEFSPGPTVADLTKALVDQPLRNATQPTDVTLDGYAGRYLEWTVPADIDFSTCDADGGEHFFQSWTGAVVGDNGPRWQQGPGQVDRLWILDINGARLVIDAFSMPSATSEERQGVVEVVKSIRVER